LFQTIYGEYHSAGPDGFNDPALSNLTASQYQDKHGAFVAKNALGELEVYERNDLTTGGGCGKPVVYLYPQQTTNVNVTVGADVVKSAPIYTAAGWRNVLAQPNGMLTYQGKRYDSLYWEGFGNGAYPAITAGTVVPRSQAVATIRQQLAAQGLNQKETDDFLEYWEPKLPTQPYIRLTWFDTEQMNQLAPLHISPTPNTVIRVFLDFQGLDQPVTLPAQTLSSLPRTGFTVVEWGGLLRDGSLNHQ
jgi:hypothetical protein